MGETSIDNELTKSRKGLVGQLGPSLAKNRLVGRGDGAVQRNAIAQGSLLGLELRVDGLHLRPGLAEHVGHTINSPVGCARESPNCAGQFITSHPVAMSCVKSHAEQTYAILVKLISLFEIHILNESRKITLASLVCSLSPSVEVDEHS